MIKNNTIVTEFKFYLYPEEENEIDLKKVFQNKDGDIVLVEIISTQFKKNHGGHDGHFRYWGKYFDDKNNLLSTTHSMPLSYNDLFLKVSSENGRNYSLNLKSNQKITNYFPGGLLQPIYKDKSSLYGFNVLHENNNPKSVWHLSPGNKKNENLKTLTQCFYCPDIKDVDPIIILDPNETGLYENKIRLFVIKDNIIPFEKEISTIGLFRENVSNMFNINSGNYCFFIEFKSLGSSHAHVHFANKKNVFDQVHMHETHWKYDGNKLQSQEVVKKNNCRKFFFYDFKNEKLENLIIINNEKIKDKNHTNIKLRLIQKKNEHCINLKISPDKPILVINIKNVFKEILNENLIIQIESYDYNFNASGIIFNKITGEICTDHFTGG